MTTYITRRKVGNKYNYYYKDELITDPLEIDRINKLAIPPAWRKVEISKAKSSKIQARGYDAAKRLQSIYHPTFRIQQDKLKFDRILRFAENLPKLRKEIEKDLARKRLDKPKVLACIVKLIDEAYFRVGNDKYAKEHHSYGITTLRSKHAEIKRTEVTFDFIGKSGQQQVKKINDSQLAHIIDQLDKMNGYKIFRYRDKEGAIHDVHSSDVNQYIKLNMGEEFTAKDFRTWGGTLLATSSMIEEELEPNANQTAKKRAVAKIVKKVAKRLGNTPAIARSSYIDPRIIVAYEDNIELPKLKETMSSMKPKKYLSIEEQLVLKLLQS